MCISLGKRYSQLICIREVTAFKIRTEKMNQQLNKMLDQLKLEVPKAELTEARARAVETRLRSEKAKVDLEDFMSAEKKKRR